jgi:hypothetical protein
MFSGIKIEVGGFCRLKEVECIGGEEELFGILSSI